MNSKVAATIWAGPHFVQAQCATPFFLVKKAGFIGARCGGVVGFAATEMESLLARVSEFGCRVDGVVQQGPNVRIHTVYDPDGNPIELSEAL